MNAAGWVVAGYAALVSTMSLAWQVISWSLARKNRVEVQVRFAFLGLGDEVVNALSVKVINRSDHTVRVTGVGLDLQNDAEERQLHQTRAIPEADLPGPVASHDAGTTYFILDEIVEQAGFDTYAPITAFAQLATGEMVKSKPTKVRTRS